MKKFFKLLKRIFFTILIIFFVLMAAGAILTKCNNSDVAAANTIDEISTVSDEVDQVSTLAYENYIWFYKDSPVCIVKEFPIVRDTADNLSHYVVFDSNTSFTNMTFEVHLSENVVARTNFVARFPGDVNFIKVVLGNFQYITVNLSDPVNLCKLSLVHITSTTFYRDLTFIVYPGEYNSKVYDIYQSGYTNGEIAGKEEGYQNGYSDGEAAGKEEGYQSGYADGEKAVTDKAYNDGYNQGILDNKYSIFNGVQVSARPLVTVHQQDYQTNEFVTHYTQDGIYFDNIASEYYRWFISASHPVTQWLSTEINLEFVEAFDPKLYPILAFGGVSDTYSKTFNVEGTDGQLYVASWVARENGGYIMSVSEDILVKKIQSIQVMGANSGFSNDFRLATVLQNFNQGYVDGYNDGLDVGNSLGYDKGYDQGITEGKAEGYANAIAEGVSQEGIFNGALSFVRIFFQLTTQFLGTKIVGDITLGLIVIGLPAVGMIVNLVIGFIKKVLGSRGSDE